jgi:hypothetical protein
MSSFSRSRRRRRRSRSSAAQREAQQLKRKIPFSSEENFQF